ncbi:hypothetical protein Poli38472_000673 [Pythium oligandrum]|uniref:Transmembrane protein 135 N-terminal domain-containing protein n=1 Tax=Pythium oligandrum TaxID=41045 RepID=A0A8K1FFJ8_PYTOL|nr:hypothetical protein Poli38472_000673 [Pythium oligandrum]|eukprot:TMW60631.1 hypothetical protein Poli38472_000673 [Pythium oligandrum]
MERIYSAFFTSDRRRDVELTAEALAKHNQEQKGARVADPTSGLSTAGIDGHSSESAGRPQMGPVMASGESSGFVLVAEGDGNSPVDEDTELTRETVDRHRTELRKLVHKELSAKHDVKAALRAALRAFLLAYGAKAFTAVLLASRKWSSIEYGYADAVRLLLRADTIRFGAFFGSLVGVFRLTELAARLARGQRDRTNLAIAGGVSGIALLMDSPERRSTIALYIFVRMLDVLGRHLTAIDVLPTWKYSSEALFAASNSAIMYAFIVDPTLLPKGYYQWILQMGGVTHHGLDYIARQRWRGELDPNGNPLGFRRCQPHYHMESCVTHSMKEWVGGFGRAMQIYLPVHFLPALIFRFPRLQQAPLSNTARISYNALCSSAFLTSYQTVVKLIVCTLRNAFQYDHPIEGVLGGVATGASLFFEDPKRRFELMLYCVPRALDIVWQLLKRRGIVRYVKHSEVALFCLSMAIITSRPAEHFKPTYLRILRFLFGQTII